MIYKCFNVSAAEGSSSSRKGSYTFHDVDSTWDEAGKACRDKGAHLVTMKTTNVKWRRAVVTLTFTLDSAKKVERGDGPRQDHLVSSCLQMTAAGSPASLPMIQEKFVPKLILFIEINTGTLTMSDVMLNIRLK